MARVVEVVSRSQKLHVMGRQTQDYGTREGCIPVQTGLATAQTPRTGRKRNARHCTVFQWDPVRISVIREEALRHFVWAIHDSQEQEVMNPFTCPSDIMSIRITALKSLSRSFRL